MDEEKIIQIALDKDVLYALTDSGQIWWISRGDKKSWFRRKLPLRNKEGQFIEPWE